MMPFTIAYRSGGTHNCTWTRLPDTQPDRAAANVKIAELQRAGRAAVADERGFPHGLPIGWDATSPNYETDDIQIVRAKDGTMLQTVHRKEFTR